MSEENKSIELVDEEAEKITGGGTLTLPSSSMFELGLG